ncbi:MAG: hypothetical protein IJ861_05115 [Clostridia bacterium]|nr:hypothetical protein [Clostridia bacterium]
MNFYDEIKERLSMNAVLERYGFEADRKGFLSCPFHTEKTASMKIYENSFYCFGCGAGGDTVKFTALLFGLTNAQAAARLDNDFGLCIRNEKPDKQKMNEYLKKKAEKEKELERFRSDYLEKCERFKRLRKKLETAEGFERAKIDSELEYLDYYFEATAWR